MATRVLPIDRRIHQAGERLVIATDRPLHELSLHRRHRIGAAHPAALRHYASADHPNGSQFPCGLTAGMLLAVALLVLEAGAAVARVVAAEPGAGVARGCRDAGLLAIASSPCWSVIWRGAFVVRPGMTGGAAAEVAAAIGTAAPAAATSSTKPGVAASSSISS